MGNGEANQGVRVKNGRNIGAQKKWKKNSSGPMIAAEQREIFRKALPGGRGMVVSERRPREPRSAGLLRLRRQSGAGTCGCNLGIFTVRNSGKCYLSSTAAVPCSH